MNEAGPSPAEDRGMISAKGPEFPREKPALRVRRALPIVPTGLWECLSSPLDQEHPERGSPS